MKRKRRPIYPLCVEGLSTKGFPTCCLKHIQHYPIFKVGNGVIFKHKKRSYAPEMAPESDDESEEDATVDNSFQEELHGGYYQSVSP